MKRDEREEVIYRALRGVETPEYDILGAVKAAREEIPRRGRPHLTRAALLAACLAAALTVGALAAGLTVGWDSFLDRTPAEGVTAVGERAVTGEYTLTLQEAIVDDEGGETPAQRKSFPLGCEGGGGEAQHEQRVPTAHSLGGREDPLLLCGV